MHYFITGASSGIGKALAYKFGVKGNKVTLVARRESLLQEIASQLTAEVFVRPTDLSSPTAILDAIQESVDSLGEIDVLINNAGIQYVEPCTALTPQRIEKLMALNCLTPMFAMNAVLPSMLAKKSGAIVNIASTAALVTAPGMALYSASKACVATYSEGVHHEVKDQGVHVLTVYPGPVKTPMGEKAVASYEENAGMKMMPEGTPGELANRIDQCLKRKKRRLDYPSFYSMVRHTRNISQWMTEKTAPQLLKE